MIAQSNALKVWKLWELLAPCVARPLTLPLLNRLVVGMTWPKAQSATRFLSLPVSRPICTPCITHSPHTALQPARTAC